ncbi:Pr6Pr family membrane protein [Microbacterium sp.]|uniref:Pr6Pr family membrane protein n=1 Tax=Microbacterium sp. TaxID=51671 RepID=UPI002812871D|nr:Pr6Pr family membrane protein [Microbacterium sp.]
MTRGRVERWILGVGRLVCAAIVVVSMVARFERGKAWVGLPDFVAYLTIQSSAAFVVVATIGGIVALRSGLDHPRLDVARVVVLACVVTAGIVFALIVQQSGARGLALDVPWSDVALHFVLPAIAVLDWIVSPRRRRVSFRVLAVIVGYPVVWGIITMIRGPIVGWYPYYFLDPGQVDDPFEFAALSGTALAVFAIVGVVLVAIPPRQAAFTSERRRAPAVVAPSG